MRFGIEQETFVDKIVNILLVRCEYAVIFLWIELHV